MSGRGMTGWFGANSLEETGKEEDTFGFMVITDMVMQLVQSEV